MLLVFPMREVIRCARKFIEADQRHRAVGSLEPETIRSLRLALVALDMAEEAAK